MGNHDDASSFHHSLQPFLDEQLAAGIDIGGRLVENHDRRMVETRSGDTEELSLPFGEIAAVIIKHRLIALGRTADEGISVRSDTGIFHFFLRRMSPDITDIVEDGIGEKMGILGHHGERPSQGIESDILNIDAVIGNLSAVDRIEPGEKRDDCRLSGSGRADKGHLLSGVYLKGDAFKNLLAFHIGEMDILKADDTLNRSCRSVFHFPDITFGELFALFVGKKQCDLTLVFLTLFIEETENPFGTCTGDENRIEMLGEVVERLAGISGEDEIRLQSAEGERTRPTGTEGENAADGRNGEIEVTERDKERRVDLGMVEGILARFSPFFVIAVELGKAFLFVGKGLDDPDAGDVLFDDGVDIGEGLLLKPVVFSGNLRIDEHEDEHDKEEEDDDEGEGDIDDKEGDDGADHVGEGEDDVG